MTFRTLALALLLPLTPGGAQAPDTARGLVLQPSAPEVRIALVIGNGAYLSAPLRNPVRDAQAMGEALRGCGFQVTLLEDATREGMFKALRAFGDALQGGGIGLFYFAGHGVQVKGRNYLVPVDANLASEDEVPYTTLDADAVLAKLETARNRLNIVILDACRNNPFGRSFRSAQQGLAQMDAPAGTYLAFATAPGHTAADGAGAHGLYTGNLLAQLATPGLRVEDVFKRVRAGVMAGSEGQQVPWESSSLTGDFYFVPGARGPDLDPPPPPRAAPRASAALEVRRDGRFIAYGDHTVLDTSTRLMWAARDNGFDINREKAEAYCAHFRAGGYTDWRLPTADELAGLYDAGRARPAPCNRDATVAMGTDLIEPTCFWAWASELRQAVLGGTASAFSFGTGRQAWLRASEGLVRRVLPVRDAK